MTSGVPSWMWPVAATAIVGVAAMVLLGRMRRRRTIFISYRRVDTLPVVRDLARRLRARFGRSVFQDEEAIPFGESFRRIIARRLQRSDVALIVIGPGWTSARDGKGALRLHDPQDVVRNEAAMALDSGALVVPVLVGGAAVPRAEDLPVDLRRIPELNALLATDLEQAVPRLIATILAAPVQRSPWMEFLGHAVVVGLVALFSLSEGFSALELRSLLFVVLPLFAATGAVTAVHALALGQRHARATFTSSRWLWVPLVFTALIGAAMVLKSMNLGIDSSQSLLTAIGVLELCFGVHTGLVLSTLFENRSDQ